MFRFLLLSFLFICGSIAGFFLHLNRENTVFKETKKEEYTGEKYSYMGMYVTKENAGTQLIKAKIPIYKEGILKTYIEAEEINWNVDKPIEMKGIFLQEYSDNGNEIVCKMSGDFGEMKLSESNELKNLRIWGNTKILKFALESDKIEK